MRRNGVLLAVFAMIAMMLGVTPAQAAPGNILPPFDTGQTWFICQGYNGSVSHTGTSQYGLDLTAGPGCGGATTGKNVRAPLGGTVHYWSASSGSLCINTSDGRSVVLTHINATVTSGVISAGQLVGTVAGPAANTPPYNGGTPHIHLQLWSTPGCWGTGNGGVPFDAAHNARICGAPDLVATGSGSNGVWSGTSFVGDTCGTPDADGDGVSNMNDLLPSIPGASNNRGVPIESSKLSGDFTGDGIRDIAVFYNYVGGQTKLWLFPGTGAGNFGTPQMKWDSGVGSWWATDIKPVVGDFNGDGLTDVGVFYNFGTQTQLYTFTAPLGGVNVPQMKWDSGAGNWNWSATQQVVGDFNGDDLEDIAAFFDYGGGRTKLWWFPATGAGNFGTPQMKWDSGAGNWWWQNSKPVVGDFNADGLQDIAAFYDYGSGSIRLWLFPSAGAGNFGTPQMKWYSGANSWWWSQIVPLAGDFNGDGLEDITVFYDHGNGHLRTWRFLGNGTGFGSPSPTWDSGPGAWWLKDVKPVVGDFDGDGMSDIAAFYNFGTQTSLWLFKNTGTSLVSPVPKWDSGPGNWNWSATLIL